MISRAAASAPVRFPESEEEEESLQDISSSSFRQDTQTVSPLHLDMTADDYKHFALQDSVLTDFFQRFQKQQTVQSSSPLSLQESFGSVRDSLDKPRLHLPRRNSLAIKNVLSQAVIDHATNKPISQPNIVNNGKFGISTLAENANSSPQLLAKTKIITNPLLQKLFRKDRIPIVNTSNEQRRIPGQSSGQSSFPARRLTGSQSTLSSPPRSAPTTSTTRRARPAPGQRTVNAESEVSLPALSVEQSPGTGTQQTLFEQIKNRISAANGREKDSKTEEELMNALIQQRVEEELARRTQEEQRRQEEERRRILAEAKKKQEKEAEEDLVFSLARSVVEQRQETRTDKESPAVWAAVRALTSFVNQIDSHDQVINIIRRNKDLSNQSIQF